MERTILISAIVIVMVMGFASVSAEIETLNQPIKSGACVNLPQQSLNASWENITTIQKPDYSKILIGALMQKNGADYNYTYCNTNLAGTYIVCGHSNLNEWCYDFEVTPSGMKNLGTFLFIFMAIILLIFLIGFKLENPWVMTLGSILILIFGFFIIKYGIDIIKDTQTTWVIGLVVWAIGIYAMYLSVEEQLKQWG